MNMSVTISPRDFATSTTSNEYQRLEFHYGEFRHILAALDGVEVIVVIDGLSLGGVTLEGLRQTPGYGTFQVLVVPSEADRAEGVRPCWYPLGKFRMIIPTGEKLGSKAARWIADETIRLEGMAAVDLFNARHPELDGMMGKVTARPTHRDGEVDVTFHPSSRENGRHTYERVNIAKATV